MRLDERRNSCVLLVINTKACTVVGTEEKSQLSDPRSELRLGTEKEKGECEDSRRNEQKKKGNHSSGRPTTSIVKSSTQSTSRGIAEPSASQKNGSTYRRGEGATTVMSACDTCNC